MHDRVQHALSPLVVLFAVIGAVLLFCLLCRVGVAADQAPPAPQSATSDTASAAEE